MIEERRELGRTGLKVSTLGFGGASLGNLYTAVADDMAHSTVQSALECGINYFDTAPLYGYGLSEHRIGAALRLVDRDDYVLSTKVGRLLQADRSTRPDEGQFPGCLPFREHFDYSYDGVMRSVEDSLQRLGTNRIEILLVHDIDQWTHGTEQATSARFKEFMQGGYRAVDELRSGGVVQAIGAGVNEWQACERLAHAGDFDCFLLAGRYSLLEQEALSSFLPLCAERNISVIIGGPYNTGILATGAIDGAYYNYQPAPPEVLQTVREIEKICSAHAVSLPSVALQFPLYHPAVVSVIPGARSVGEVTGNVRLLNAPVPEALWSDLKLAGLLRSDAPTPG